MAAKKDKNTAKGGLSDKQKEDLLNIFQKAYQNTDTPDQELTQRLLAMSKEFQRKNKEKTHKEKARERWKEVGTRRLNQVLIALNSLEKCAHPYNYNYTESEVKKMFKEIDTKLSHLKKAFNKNNDDLDYLKDKIFDDK